MPRERSDHNAADADMAVRWRGHGSGSRSLREADVTRAGLGLLTPLKNRPINAWSLRNLRPSVIVQIARIGRVIRAAQTLRAFLHDDRHRLERVLEGHGFARDNQRDFWRRNNGHEDSDSVQEHYEFGEMPARIEKALLEAGLGSGPIEWSNWLRSTISTCGDSRQRRNWPRASGWRGAKACSTSAPGLGGPARYLAAVHGCRVTGIELTPAFVEIADRLSLTDRALRPRPLRARRRPRAALPPEQLRPRLDPARGDEHPGQGAAVHGDPSRAQEWRPTRHLRRGEGRSRSR